MRLYYAQNKEDLIIKGFFPDIKDGFYIDVGANDPVVDSVTKLLYEEGWSGIDVEPIGNLAEALRHDRPRDTVLQIGLSNKAGKLTFTEYPEGNGLSTFDAGMSAYYERGSHPFPTEKTKKYTVPVKTLDEIIHDARVRHIHMLKVDVEGYEYEVIAGKDWREVRPELICIEANHITHDWRPVLDKHNYYLVFFDGVNNYYLAQESLHRKEYFNYPDVAFSGNPVYFQAYKEVREPIETELRALLSKAQSQEEEIAFLHRQQRDVRFLAKRLALELQLRFNKRASAPKRRAGLRYGEDPALVQQLAQQENGDNLLHFIHERDKVNIKQWTSSTTEALRPIPWKVAAGTLNMSIAVAKKGVKRLR